MGVLRISHNKTLAEFNPFVSSAWENMHKTSLRIDKDVTAIKISQQGLLAEEEAVEGEAA